MQPALCDSVVEVSASDEWVRTRLDSIALGDSETLAVGATIRPHAQRDTVEVQRELPRISVDLRPPGAPVLVGAAAPDLEVSHLLGQGGMGRVFLARQRSLERDVAIKTGREGASSAELLAILREGVITGRLEHPAIVPVHALGADVDGRPVMVMKRIEGVAWDTLFRDPSHPGWEGWGGDPGDRLAGHLQILL
jgi:eukaryotic-like serine/threonine-protein kinase